jgi:hypothetical protein
MGYLFHTYTCVETKKEEKYPSRCFLSPPIFFSSAAVPSFSLSSGCRSSLWEEKKSPAVNLQRALDSAMELISHRRFLIFRRHRVQPGALSGGQAFIISLLSSFFFLPVRASLSFSSLRAA